MNNTSIIIAVLFAGFAVSYGWGMRGYIIGGEKGALVPGALLGLSMALFCGNGALKEFFPFFCAAGALGMSFGGIDTYAQTMAYVLRREDEPYKGKLLKGCTGIFLKGAVWFGIAGSVLAILPGALSGEIYGIKDITVLFVTIPVTSLVGTQLLNKPFDPSNNKFSKIYFSVDRFEEWGGNLFVLAELIIFAAIKRDMFTVGAAVMGILSGGFGFLLGLLSYDATVRKHNGKYLFGSLQEKGMIDGWKIMEHFLGAMGGGGLMLYFCLRSDVLTASFAKANPSALFFGGERDILSMYIVIGMVALTALQYPVRHAIAKKGKEPDDHPFELCERPLWASFALIFIMGGSVKAACASAFMTVAYAYIEKCDAEWYSEKRDKKLLRIIFTVQFIGCAIYFFACGGNVSLLSLTLIYTFYYTVPTVVNTYTPSKDGGRPKGKGFFAHYVCGFTVTTHFLIQCAVITAVAVLK